MSRHPITECPHTAQDQLDEARWTACCLWAAIQIHLKNKPALRACIGLTAYKHATAGQTENMTPEQHVAGFNEWQSAIETARTHNLPELLNIRFAGADRARAVVKEQDMTRPPIKCTSCGGDGFLHISESIMGGPFREIIDKDEPCWSCGGTGLIYDGAINANGESLYDAMLAKPKRAVVTKE